MDKDKFTRQLAFYSFLIVILNCAIVALNSYKIEKLEKSVQVLNHRAP